MRRQEVIGKAEPEPVNLAVKQNLNQLSIEDEEKVEKVQPVSVKHTEDLPEEQAKPMASVASVHETKPQEEPTVAKNNQEEAKHNEEYAHFSQKLESEAKSAREADDDGTHKNYPNGSVGDQE